MKYVTKEKLIMETGFNFGGNMFTKKPFLKLKIGGMFFAHDTTWVRTSYRGATCIAPNKSGSCDFTIDKEDEIVLAIDGTIVDDFIKTFTNGNEICRK